MVQRAHPRIARRPRLTAFWLTVSLWVGLVIPPAAQALTVDQLMVELAGRAEAVVSFKETKHSALLKTPIELAGELRYRRPDFLEKQVRVPFEERYTIEGSTVTIERGRDGSGGRKHTLSLQSQPMLRALIDSIRSTLQGDAAALRKFYRLELIGEASAWTLVLLPADVQLAEFVTVIRMTGGGGILRSMEIVETSGDRTVTRFEARR